MSHVIRSALLITVAASTMTCAHAQGLDALIQSCAPLVHPVTMGKLIRVESSGHYFALTDDGPGNLPWRERKHLLRSYNPATMTEALDIGRRLSKEGHIFDVGLSQVSSRNFAHYGITLEQALEPCTNLSVGSRILTDFYLSAQRTKPNPAEAVLAAISAYNTGNFVDGFSNGYVHKVLTAGTVPALANRYDARLPESRAGAYSDQPAGNEPYPVRYVRPPELLSHKVTVLHVDTEEP